MTDTRPPSRTFTVSVVSGSILVMEAGEPPIPRAAGSAATASNAMKEIFAAMLAGEKSGA